MLSLIIVNWNAINYLVRCIESLCIALDDFEYEIIVVDNGSTDGSQKIIKEKFNFVKLICLNYNVGFGKANNIGLRECKGEIVFLINSDVIVFKDCFDKLVPIFKNLNNRIGIIGPKILDKHFKIQRSIMNFPSIKNHITKALALDVVFPKIRTMQSFEVDLIFHKGNRYVDIVNGCFMMIRREAIKDVGLFDERFFIYGEDIDLCRRFWMKDWAVLFCEDVSVIHFGGASSANSPSKFFIEMLKANLQIWKKYYGIKKSKFYLIIIMLHHLIRFYGYGVINTTIKNKNDKIKFKIKRSAIAVEWSFKNICQKQT